MLESIPIEVLRAAAKAWRKEPGVARNIHDRIDDLIDEVERLRKPAGATHD